MEIKANFQNSNRMIGYCEPDFVEITQKLNITFECHQLYKIQYYDDDNELIDVLKQIDVDQLKRFYDQQKLRKIKLILSPINITISPDKRENDKQNLDTPQFINRSFDKSDNLDENEYLVGNKAMVKSDTHIFSNENQIKDNFRSQIVNSGMNGLASFKQNEINMHIDGIETTKSINNEDVYKQGTIISCQSLILDCESQTISINRNCHSSQDIDSLINEKSLKMDEKDFYNLISNLMNYQQKNCVLCNKQNPDLQCKLCNGNGILDNKGQKLSDHILKSKLQQFTNIQQIIEIVKIKNIQHNGNFVMDQLIQNQEQDLCMKCNRKVLDEKIHCYSKLELNKFMVLCNYCYDKEQFIQFPQIKFDGNQKKEFFFHNLEQINEENPSKSSLNDMSFVSELSSIQDDNQLKLKLIK